MSSIFCIMCKKNFFYFTRNFGYILHSGQGKWGQGGLEYHAVQNGAAGGGFWTGGVLRRRVGLNNKIYILTDYTE